MTRLNEQDQAELVRFWQEGHGLEPDGIVGPATIATIEAARLARAPNIRGAVEWQPFDGPLVSRPTGRRGVYQVFGDPGVGKVDPDWYRQNIIECHVSHGNALPLVPRHLYVKVHRKIEPYVREGLRRAGIACPDWKPERVAGFVFRHQRHDPSRPLSKHSFGCAIDFDPHKNAAKNFPRGQTPEPFGEAWRKHWPEGLPEGVVKAMESCGFAWGSDWDEDGHTTDHMYSDPMHFEFTERGGRRSV